MTPRERWDAAVQMQHDAAARVEAMPLDDFSMEDYRDVLNAATSELEDASGAMEDAGLSTRGEFAPAYRVCLEATRRLNRRVCLSIALRVVDSFVADVGAVWRAAAPHASISVGR